MREKVKKLLEYKITNSITEEQLCSEIGINRRTFYNVKLNNDTWESTKEKINTFILEKDL